MNKKVLAISIALLMVLGTVFVAVPVHAIVTPLPTLSSTQGAAGSAVTITAPGGAIGTGLTPSREVFVMFDREVADPDLGMAMTPFAANEMYVNTAPGFPATYIPGEPIYLHVIPVPAVVAIGDTRLTQVTSGANVYPAGSVVAGGNTDIGNALLAMPANTFHTGPAPYAPGQGIYIRDALNNVAGWNDRVGPGDLRALYPSVRVTVVGGITATYAAWTKVYSPVLDYQKPIYYDIGALNAGSVGAGDQRERNVVIPQVSYAAGSTVTAGERELVLALATTAFAATDWFVDMDGSGAWTSGEAIYGGVVAPLGLVKAGDTRNSYVTGVTAAGLTFTYMPTTVVAAGDLDIGTAIIVFPATQSWYGPVAVYRYGDWIYNNGLAAPGAIVAGWTRASVVDWTDKGMAAALGLLSGLLPAAWAVNWPNVVGYAALSVVAAGDSDVGRLLTAFLPTDKHAYAVVPGLYVSGSPIYSDNDNDNLISVDDTRQVIVSTASPRIYAGWPTPWPDTAAPFYIPGSAVVAGDADIVAPPALQTFCTGVGNPVAVCLGPEMYYDDPLFLDRAYLGSDLVAVGGVSGPAAANGYAAPFPVANALTAAVPIPFTVPRNAPLGNHVVMITTDEPPTPALAAPFLNAGWQATAAFVPLVGGTLPMESLPWFIGVAPNHWPTANFGTQAGPAFYVVDVPIRVFLHPGVADPYKPGWSHTLDTYWGTQAGAMFGDPSAPGNPGWGPAMNRQTRELFNHYLDYAILASSSDSVGDFQFDITVLAPINGLRIWIPGETPGGNGDGFRWLAPSVDESVWTDITNDYEFIWTGARSAYDTIEPYGLRISIGLDDWSANQLTIYPGTYHVRLFDLAAPKVAGLYHFKIMYYVGGTGFMLPAGDFPIMIVKSELNPAWISVDTLAYLNFNFGFGPFLSGSVLAQGTTPEGRTVFAQAWWGPNEWMRFNAIPGQWGGVYRVFIFGVAEGTYTLTSQASGYNPTVSDRITVLAGQSYHMNIEIFDSPDFHVTVWSKHGTGAIPWHNLWELPFGTNDPYIAPDNTGPRRDMTLELYDSSGNMVGWWASNAEGALSAKSIGATNILAGYHDDFVVPPVPYALFGGGTIPTSDHYNAWLTDNWDLLLNPRGIVTRNPSTHWDGHVPWTAPDYIAGLPQGQYSLEAFVTGYIMDEMDAYQRSFAVVGTAISLQMDLRRSNWIETVMYLPDSVFLSTADTTVTLTAEDSGANERGAAGLSVSWAIQTTVPVASTHRIDAWWVGLMPNAIAHDGGIVIEGWNNIFPCAGGARAPFRDPQMHDYGLNPTKPATDILLYGDSGPEVLKTDGNPYTIKLYMSDMGFPYLTGSTTLGSTALVGSVRGTGFYSVLGSDPQVSVFLCNSAQLLSFSIVNAWLWISIRSVDFQIPAHSQPWTFPGSAMWIEFLDASGADAGVLDPTLYGLIQDAGTTVAGWVIPGAPALSFGVSPFDIDNVNVAGMHEHVGVNFYGDDWCSTTLGGAWGWPFGLLSAWRSTRLVPGQYTYDVHTHGYIMRRSYPVQVPQSTGADIEADVIQGGQIRVILDFWHEAIATPFNGFIRMEVFDANDNLVGASIYGQAQPNVFLTAASPTPHAAYLAYDPGTDWMGGTVDGFAPVTVAPDSAWNWGPAQAHDFGLPVATFPSTQAGLPSYGQRGFWSWLFYGVPALPWWPNTNIANFPWPGTAPADANRFLIPVGNAQSIDSYGFYWYYGDKARTWAGGWPTVSSYAGATAYTDSKWDSGIKGTVDITGWSGSGGGLYSVKIWAFDPRGPNNAYEAAAPTDDWRMYSMGWELSNIQVPWGGAHAVYIAMNDMASLRGTVEWVDMFGNARPLAWAMISATNPDTVAYATGNGGIGAGASDPSGAYIMWLPAGIHDVSVSTSEAPQIWSSAVADGTLNPAFTVTVSNGWVGGGLTRLGHQTGVPVPEFPAFLMPLGLFAALAASVWLLRKRNLVNVPVLTN